MPKNANHDSRKKVTILLDQASLESIKGAGGKEYQLLNPDKHRDRIARAGRDVSMIRPDITHQCLLMLQDSPLNRLGKLQVYIRTTKNIVIEVNPKCRIPRTFDRFCGLMVQLLQKLSVHASEGSHEKLMRIVKNPVSMHFPTGALVVGTSHSADEQLTTSDLPSLAVEENNFNLVIVIGAMPHGSIVKYCSDFLQKTVSLSKLPMSAAQVCDRICAAFEEKWDIENEFEALNSV